VAEHCFNAIGANEVARPVIFDDEAAAKIANENVGRQLFELSPGAFARFPVSTLTRSGKFHPYLETDLRRIAAHTFLATVAEP
jgi:hypothetical protein